MRSPLTLLIFLLLSSQAIAADLQNIVNHIQDKGIKDSAPKAEENISPKTQSSNDQALTGELSYLKHHKKLDQKLTKSPAPKILATLLVEKDLVKRHDQAYLETQEKCAFIFEGEPHFKDCEKLITLYENINDQLNERLDDGEVVDKPVENLFGTSLDGDVVTRELTSSADPNSDLKEQSEKTPGRNSPLQKGHTIETDEEVEQLSLSTVTCRIQQRKESKLPKELLNKLVTKLEETLTSEETSLEKKKEVYCVLYSYYQEEELMNKITLFLYLNMPGESVKCE